MNARIIVLMLMACVIAFSAYLVATPSRSAASVEVPEKYRDTVHKGLEYLVKQQHKDGHWEEPGGKNPVATTALAGIALLVEGKGKQDIRSGITFSGKRKYADEIRRAADWLIQLSAKGKDGLIYSGHPSETSSYMEGHGLAVLFLSGVSKKDADGFDRLVEKLEPTRSRAISWIFKAQSTQGGWYYTSRTEGHDLAAIMPTVIQVQALQATGYSDSLSSIKDSMEYLRVALAKKGDSKVISADRLAETAAAFACRVHGLGDTIDDKDDLCRKWLAICQAEIPAVTKMVPGRDELAHSYYAQALFRHNPEGDAWKTYRSATFDHLQSTQKADGSWPVGGDMAPIRAAALWCIVLQLDNKSHPAMRWNNALEVARGPNPFLEPCRAEPRERSDYTHRPLTRFGSPTAYQPEAQARALS